MKIFVLTVNNLHPNYWAHVVIFMHWCLTSIKHGTPRNILFCNIVWLQNKFVQSRKKIYSSVCSTFAMSIADVLLLVDLFGIQKMSCWQCCCSCLQHGGLEAKALVVEHFGVCCTLCGLRPFFEMYIWASVLILTSHQNFKVATMVQLGDNVATLQKLSLCVKHDCYAGDVHHPAYCGSGIASSTMLLCITENQSG
jgi:hypothetical protein